MNNFIQHVTGQLVWLGEHRGLFLLLIVELFAGVCLLIGFFQLKAVLDPLVYRETEIR